MLFEGRGGSICVFCINIFFATLLYTVPQFVKQTAGLINGSNIVEVLKYLPRSTFTAEIVHQLLALPAIMVHRKIS